MKEHFSVREFLDKLDWFIIRRDSMAWHWRVEYLLLWLAVANIIALLLAVTPIGDALDYEFFFFFMCLFLGANAWFNLAFDSAEHIYSGNGIAPLLLGTLILIQPLLVFLSGMFDLLKVDLVAHVAFSSIVLLYFHKLILFRIRPRAYKPFNLKFAMIATMCAFVVFLIGIATLAIDPALVSEAPASGARVERTAPENFVAGSSGSNVAQLTLTVPTFGSPRLLLSRAGASPQATVSFEIVVLFGAMVLSWIGWRFALAIAKTVYRFVISPLIDVDLHRRLILGPQKGDSSQEWANRIFIYSIVIPVVALVLDFSVRLWLLPIPLDRVISTPTLIAILVFVFFQSRSFQPYMNDYHAQLPARATSIGAAPN
jgi:hypothetical protein